MKHLPDHLPHTLFRGPTALSPEGGLGCVRNAGFSPQRVDEPRSPPLSTPTPANQIPDSQSIFPGFKHRSK